jgi:glycosyltransferase involved in cell wall biosynthesis
VAESALTPDLAGESRDETTRPLLSIVVPVYSQPQIADNVRVIRERVAQGLGEPFELIVVSDGSEGDEDLLAESTGLARVIHYDRNLGKGFAVKAGALVARGEYISYVDSDLDLDPASIPEFLRLAQRNSLDFVIGSKRHPDSVVRYPRSRRVGSWLYQQAVRLLFSLDVRDTQVGLKVFRREVAEEVLPLLLVKQFAFDLEFLAVARSLGYGRIEEQPVRLEYQFTGSGVRSPAVLLALVDTLAIFYRLRILRYYQRKRRLLPAYARRQDFKPRVSVIAPEEPRLEYPDVTVIQEDADTPEARAAALDRADGEVIAFVERDAVPAANWLSATIPFLANPLIAAVVTPRLAPSQGSLRERAAAALQETFLGGGSHYFRFTPGNLRFVKLFPGGNLVARRSYLQELPDRDLHPHLVCAALADRGRFVLYTPETVVVAPTPPLFKPYLRQVVALGRSRGRTIRQRGLSGISGGALPPIALLTFLLGGWVLVWLGGTWLVAWVLVWAAYFALVALNALVAGLRFRSVRIAALTAAGSMAAHLTYAAGLVVGLVRRS